ncbi:MAG: NUDIX hydrolase [Marinovum sp.]|nr:NUDIX hydrolase [Marinovum sp.]
MEHDPPIRDAATVIVVRDARTNPRILMGQRGARAAFMPNKFVFPGGAVDADDGSVIVDVPPEPCLSRLTQATDGLAPRAIVAAAIRELWEETGLRLARSAREGELPPPWPGFGTEIPDGRTLRFVFRAVTPPGRPRRFDARFFALPAEAIAGDLDDFSAASDELSHLQWVSVSEARRLDLPFITKVVLAELAARPDPHVAPPHVPFFQNDDEELLYRSLGETD